MCAGVFAASEKERGKGHFQAEPIVGCDRCVAHLGTLRQALAGRQVAVILWRHRHSRAGMIHPNKARTGWHEHDGLRENWRNQRCGRSARLHTR